MRFLLIISFLTTYSFSAEPTQNPSSAEVVAPVMAPSLSADDIAKIAALVAASIGKSSTLIMPSAGIALGAGGVIAFGGGMILIGTVLGSFFAKRFLRGPKDAVKLHEFEELRRQLKDDIGSIADKVGVIDGRVTDHLVAAHTLMAECKTIGATSARLHAELPVYVEAAVVGALTRTGLNKHITDLTSAVGQRLPETLSAMRQLYEVNKTLAARIDLDEVSRREHVARHESAVIRMESTQQTLHALNALVVALGTKIDLFKLHEDLLLERMSTVSQQLSEMKRLGGPQGGAI